MRNAQHNDQPYLVRGRSFSDHNVTRGSHHSNPVGVQELAVPLTHLPKLELEVPLLVKHLDTVVVGVGHNDLVVLGDCHSTWLSELTLENTKLSKLAMIDHLLATNLSFRRVDNRSRGHRGCQGGGGAHGQWHGAAEVSQHVGA